MKNLPIILLIVSSFIVGGVLYLLISQTEGVNSTNQPIERYQISGSLTYPSNRIPDGIEVCAQNISTGKKTCSTEAVYSPSFAYQQGYELYLESGDYHVYAEFNGQKAYYNQYMVQFAKNFMWPDYQAAQCDNYQPIELAVSGSDIAGIALGDWYFDANC